MAEFVPYADLKVRVARKLQIVADSESLSAEDGELIEVGLSAVETAINTLGITSLDIADGVNEPLAEPLVMMAAAYVVDEFQIPDPRRSVLRAEGMIGLPGRSIAERQLRTLVNSPTVKLAVATDVTYI